MLRPQFRYSHILVGKLLEIETAQATLPGSLPGLPQQLDRIGHKSSDYPEEDTLEALHQIADPGSSGYRRDGGLVYNAARTDIVYIPPEPEDVPELVADLIDWLDAVWTSAPAVVLSGVLEEELLLIQPFERRNSELARLAGDTVLLRKGYRLVPAVRSHFGERADKYADASHAVHSGVFSEQADLSQWLEFYATEIADATAALQAPAAPASVQLPDAPVILRDRQLQALHYIQDNGAIRSGQYQRLAGIVPDTARRDFDDLMAKGLIEVRGVGRATHYVLTQRGVDQAQRRRVS